MAHAMLVAAYHLLARKTTYHDPGADYYERRHADRVCPRAVRSWSARGTAWSSNPRPEREVPSERDFLSNPVRPVARA